MSRITPPQRALFAEALQERNPFLPATPIPTDGTAGAFSLSGQPGVRLLERPGGSITGSITTLRFDLQHGPEARRRVALTVAPDARP